MTPRRAQVPVTGALLDATGSWALVFGVTSAHYVVGAAVWLAWSGASQLPEDGAPLLPALRGGREGSEARV